MPDSVHVPWYNKDNGQEQKFQGPGCDFVDHLRPERSRGLIRLMVADKPLTWKTMKEFLCSHSSHARPSKTGHNIELGHLDLAPV